MDSLNKVYITNYAGHDFDDAKNYGEIVVIFKGYISFQSLDRVKYDVCAAIKDSSPDDYLCLSGVGTIQMLAVAAWMHLHGSCKCLIWDIKNKDKYRLMKLSHMNFLDIFDQIRSGEPYAGIEGDD